ncbi:hypothetical protein BX666DRAFT_791924 [Dichotomocladium elegans]|nr:hypothetical protein BX666DRAFT_791924 [Dichotomocladium elegans]
MTQSSPLHVLGDNKSPEPYDSHGDRNHTNVHGWLMGVHGYSHNERDARYDTQVMSVSVVGKSTPRRPLSMTSISSEDSVNLDDLIKANYASDMDEETNLPDLADLDLDDSDEEFWKLDEATFSQHTKNETTRPRSGSMSSENSMTSQSTVTLNANRLHSNSILMGRSVSAVQHNHRPSTIPCIHFAEQTRIPYPCPFL